MKKYMVADAYLSVFMWKMTKIFFAFSKVAIRRDFALFFSITEVRNCDCGRIRRRIRTCDSLFDRSSPPPDYVPTPSRIGLGVPTMLTPKGQNPDCFKASQQCETSIPDFGKYSFGRPTHAAIQHRCQNPRAKCLSAATHTRTWNRK